MLWSFYVPMGILLVALSVSVVFTERARRACNRDLADYRDACLKRDIN